MISCRAGMRRCATSAHPLRHIVILSGSVMKIEHNYGHHYREGDHNPDQCNQFSYSIIVFHSVYNFFVSTEKQFVFSF